MRVILQELYRKYPKDQFEFRDYLGEDPLILRMQKAGIGCYNLMKNGKRLPVVLYDFNFYRRGRLRDSEEVFDLIDPLTKLLILKYK
jgi:hypothetical protein